MRLMTAAKTDLCMIDCLSFPLSVILGLEQMAFFEHVRYSSSGQVHIVCIGTSAKAEERVLVETECFEELFLALEERDISRERVQLHLCGPEMSRTYDHSTCVHIHKSVSVQSALVLILSKVS
jgi:hypothetical protein